MEITQTLVVFRQLLIGELGGYAALVGSMLVVAGQDAHAYISVCRTASPVDVSKRSSGRAMT